MQNLQTLWRSAALTIGLLASSALADDQSAPREIVMQERDVFVTIDPAEGTVLPLRVLSDADGNIRQVDLTGMVSTRLLSRCIEICTDGYCRKYGRCTPNEGGALSTTPTTKRITIAPKLEADGKVTFEQN